MIISVDTAKQFVNLDGWSDDKIEMKLKAIEQSIRAYTNNNFQRREYRKTADIVGGLFIVDALNPFENGDTVQISEPSLNAGLRTVVFAGDSTFSVDGDVVDEDNILVTKVEYPADVIACALNLMEWEVNNRAKVGVQSETLSRHSVTYFNMGAADQVMGYPASLLGCLKPHRKARF